MEMLSEERISTIGTMDSIVFETSMKNGKRHKRNKATRNKISLRLSLLLKILIRSTGIINNINIIEILPIRPYIK
jgi:uncharacterized membrane protein